MDSKDVEEIFKGVLTDESQESQESSVFPIQPQVTPHASAPSTPLVSPSPHPGKETLIKNKNIFFMKFHICVF